MAITTKRPKTHMVRLNVAGVWSSRMSPLVRLRTLVMAWRTAQAERVRARWAGEPDAPARVARARKALGTGEARALLDECVSLRIVDEADQRALLVHLADAAREELLERRDCPGTFVIEDEVEVGGEPLSLGAIALEASRWTERARLEAAAARVTERARRWREAHEEADAIAARVLSRGPGAEKEPALDELLEAFLRATDDAAAEALARSQHALGASATRATVPERLGATARALRAAPLDALFAREGRIARLGRALAPLGADASVASRLRVDTSSSLDVRGEVLLVAPPTRVVLGASPIELGLGSELDALELFGRAMSYARTSAALADEQRVLPQAHVPGLVASTFGLFLGATVFLSRALGLDERAAAATAATASYLGLVRARLDAARCLSRARRVELASDEAHALVQRALALPAALPLGFLLASGASSPELELLARSQALAPLVFVALRERHDEDFFRNPRTGDTLGGAMARGARLTRAQWCAELGASGDPAEAARALARERLG